MRLDNAKKRQGKAEETYIQITACGSLDRDVPSRNLRRWSLVSCEKVYSLDSDDWIRVSRGRS